MRFIVIFAINILCGVCYAFGQIGGESVYPFLGLSTSCNYASMGGACPSVDVAGVNSLTSNPALIDTTDHLAAALNMVSYVADIGYGSALFGGRAGKTMISGGAELVNYGDFTLTDEAANNLGTFNCRDYLLIASAARHIMDSLPLTAGVSMKTIISKMETYHSTGIAFDFGLRYYFEKQKITIGLAVLNLGCQLTTYSDNTREKLPLDIRLGISKQLLHAPLRFSLTVRDLQKPKLADDFGRSFANHLIFSAELFPQGVVSLKGGFNVMAHNDLYVTDGSVFPGFSFGVDVRLKRISVQYSHQCISPAESANMFTVELMVGKMMR
ncbi:MAG: type IX secretion system protein PorQ [Bacteroidales bacterium]|nr:type IX secretion system protein PorQ [Bacteroidales bacterium]